MKNESPVFERVRGFVFQNNYFVLEGGYKKVTKGRIEYNERRRS